MSLHKELKLEEEICAHLREHGWLYANGDHALYDRVLAIFPSDVLSWVKGTQPKAWEMLQKQFGNSAEKTLYKRLREELNARGTLEVLRTGIDVLGLKERVRLAEFKPAMKLNEEISKRYMANRLRVVRQVHYSHHNENASDLVLFLNGIPVASVELKTDFTQDVKDAIQQYKKDRLPTASNGQKEPLFTFPSGALVHFAVSNSEVFVTTKLEGKDTTFLPFNKGHDGGAGNPPNEESGHRTAYLWEEVWERESFLELLGRYLTTRKDKNKTVTQVIFPRYHQLDVTRKLQAAILKDGPGAKYLVQHSAGSGKTNSIAWAAHFLSELHDDFDKKVFDSVLVVSDRNVIDAQLQEAIFDFQRTLGVVEVIDDNDEAKSARLAKALAGTKKIVVCTVQTFPFAIDAVRELAATQGKRFAVIADEAHSSQAGETAAKLKQVLSPDELKELEDGGEVSSEDILAAQMAARASDKGITFVAFTATPKAKTLELFGTRPDPTRRPGPDNVPTPFHVYSMRQAIEEGFIVDVLQNYTSYGVAFKLVHEGKEFEGEEVERSRALKKLLGWVKLHPHNIAQKVELVIEHYRAHVQPLLSGRAKAMVVVGSRLEAVRWQLAMQKYITEKGYSLGTLVAFSGEVLDPESGPEPFSEKSTKLNPGLNGRDIRDAFKGGEYQVLIAANKFQTGFDQPLLCGMYVDKRLAGIQAVQTLSRLNRAYPDKDTTYILDFVNDPAEVLEAFRTYYTTAELAGVTDPHLIYALRQKLDGAQFYDDNDVDRVAKVELNPKSTQAELLAAIEPTLDRLLRAFKSHQTALKSAVDAGKVQAEKDARAGIEALQTFKKDMGAYVRAYMFLSQIFDYGNTDFEKRALFYKRLIPLLDFGRDKEDIDLSGVRLTHYAVKNKGKASMVLGGERRKLDPLTETGSHQVQEREKALLREIIEKVNTLFEGELTEQDKLAYVLGLEGKLLESTVLLQQATNNSKEQFESSPDLKAELNDAIIALLDAYTLMSTQALNSEAVKKGLLELLLKDARLYDALRLRARGPEPTADGDLVLRKGILQGFVQSPVVTVSSQLPEETMRRIEQDINEFSMLEPGWNDGDGESLSKAGLAWLRGLLLRLMDNHELPMPTLSPMPEGGVKATWKFRPWYLTAEFDLEQHSAFLHAAQVKTDQVETLDVSFTSKNKETPLNEFASFVRRIASLKEME